MATGIILSDFQLTSNWEACPETLKPYSNLDREQGSIEMGQIVDEAGRKYLHESEASIRNKCVGLAFSTPIVQVLAATLNIIKIAFRLLFFYHFWPKDSEPYNFTASLTNAGKDLLCLVATPFAIIGLEAAAIYGIFSPNNGRKLYATLERAMYDIWRLAPCFQPNIQAHSLPTYGDKRAF